CPDSLRALSYSCARVPGSSARESAGRTALAMPRTAKSGMVNRMRMPAFSHREEFHLHEAGRTNFRSIILPDLARPQAPGRRVHVTLILPSRLRCRSELPRASFSAIFGGAGKLMGQRIPVTRHATQTDVVPATTGRCAGGYFARMYAATS